MRRSLGTALVAAGLLAYGGAAVLGQQRPDTEDVPFVDGARVDSLRAVLTPERLLEMRRAAADGGDHRAWYNIGAALLLAGAWQEAVEPLQRAGGSGDAALEEATAYNLGVSRAVAGRPDPNPRNRMPPAGSAADARRAHLVQARDAFRRVLRADPEADDARWNLEVVERWLSQVGGAGGGGQGGGQGGGESDDPTGERRELTEDEIQRLLEAAASEERRVQSERFERSRARDPVAERNW